MTSINKTELLDNIKRTIDTLQAHGDANYIRGMSDAMKIVEAYPSIEPIKRGRWKQIVHPWHECSECGERTADSGCKPQRRSGLELLS